MICRAFYINKNTECMKFLEKDLEEIIYNSYKKDMGLEIRKRGLEINGRISRQLRIGNYGVADLVTLDLESVDCYEPYFFDEKTITLHNQFNVYKTKITIFELKKDKIGISALLQAVRYSKGVSEYLQNVLGRDKGNFDIDIVLVGRTIDTSGSFCFMTDLFDNLNTYTYSYDVNGLSFQKQDNYKLTNNSF